MNEYKPRLVNLGWCMARIFHHPDNLNPQLIIVSPGCAEENLCSPATSIEINGRENVLALRDALLWEFPPEKDNAPAIF